MAKIKYEEHRFNTRNLGIIEKANEIIEAYMDDGMHLTLRQLYYQFVARDLIANSQHEYDKLGNTVSNARLAGLIDWDAIIDRTRNLRGLYHNTDVGDAVDDALRQFHLDYWEDQDYRVEVWIEKEALVGVIGSICGELDVPYFACKGYVSQSEMHSAAQRLRHYSNMGQTPVIIHLGDHDPSGMDMTRDIEDRQDLFTAPTIVRRIALNMEQVRKYKPPPNPAKITDSRAEKYIAKFGSSSWELDALEPKMMRQLIKDTVEEYRDQKRYEKILKIERMGKATLRRIVAGWETL